MSEGSLHLFRSLSTYGDLQQLIANGEAEGLYLECKAPAKPLLTRALRAHLAKAVSGFSNTVGGVVIWGISTTRHQHSGLDVLTQMEPIGQCRRFEQQVQKAIPSLTIPPVLGAELKVIRERSRDTRGVVLAHIFKFDGDPVQSNLDNLFYFRSGDEFRVAPYEMIKRLFAASEAPDIRPLPVDELVKLRDDGVWEIPICVENRSTAIGEHVFVSVTVSNPSACESISVKGEGFHDVSNLNPGRRVFNVNVPDVVYRGVKLLIGSLLVKMKVGKRPKRALKLRIEVFADRMRARVVHLTLHVAKTGFSISQSDEQFLY